jgi:hypothetical protein
MEVLRRQHEETQAQQPEPRRIRLAGPDIRVRAPGGVVPTRSEVEEELRNRRAYGVGKD